MESEGAQAQRAAPEVEQQQAVAAPAPRSGAAAFAAAHGNVAVARLAGTSLAPGSGLTPGAVRALAPHTGNAAIARMLRGQAALARENENAPPSGSGGSAPPAGPAPAGAPPNLSLPGGVPVQVPAGPGELASKSFDKVVKAGEKKVGLRVPIPPPLAAEIGGTISGLARFAGGFALRWDRPESEVTDPLAVKDTIKVENGRLGATGTVAGGIYGRIGVDVKLAHAFATASGTLQAKGAGELNATGEVTREGVNNQWQGGINWNLTATGTLTAAASGYFEWKVLWFHGREEIFKLESFPLGTITVKLGGQLKPNGDVTCPTRDFDIQLGSPPPAKKISEKAVAPSGGQPAGVAPKRASPGEPPDEPPRGGALLLRQPDDQGGDPRQVAGGNEEEGRLPEGASGGDSAFVPSEEQDAPEP